MKLISEYHGHILEIITPSFFKNEFNFVANDLVLGSLKNIDFWGNRYEINYGVKTWEIALASIWKGKVDIKEKGKELPFAFYEPLGLKQAGSISLPNGEKINLVFNLWKSAYELRNQINETIVTFSNKSFFSSTIVVTINKKNELIDKYPFVILLAYYISMKRKHAAAAIAH